MAIACVCLLAGSGPRAAAPPPPEYLIKAAYLYNFAMFVDWPAASFARRDSPIVIGVLGSDPFGAALDETVRNKSVNNRPIRIDRLQSTQDLVALPHPLREPVGHVEAQRGGAIGSTDRRS